MSWSVVGVVLYQKPPLVAGCRLQCGAALGPWLACPVSPLKRAGSAPMKCKGPRQSNPRSRAPITPPRA